MQHAARLRQGLEDGNGKAETGQVIGGAQAGRAGADDRDLFLSALSRRIPLHVHPSVVGQETFESPDVDRLIEVLPVAVRFTWVIADPPADAGKRVVLPIDAQGLVVIALRRLRKARAMSLPMGQA